MQSVSAKNKCKLFMPLESRKKIKFFFIWSYLPLITGLYFLCYLLILFLFVLLQHYEIWSNAKEINLILASLAVYFLYIPLFFVVVLTWSNTIYYIIKTKMSTDLTTEKKRAWIKYLIIFNMTANIDYYETFISGKDLEKSKVERWFKKLAQKMSDDIYTAPGK